jgi:hypothetical protein
MPVIFGVPIIIFTQKMRVGPADPRRPDFEEYLISRLDFRIGPVHNPAPDIPPY